MDRAEPRECPHASAACDVFVGVFCPSNPQTHCIVSVDANVVVLRTSAGAKKVTWRLDTGGDWKFATPGISIDPAAFSCAPNGPFIVACTATTGAANQYKYTVKVEPRTGNRVADPLDPWVVTN